LARWDALKLDHAEGWEAAAVGIRGQLRRVLGDFPKLPRLVAKLGRTEEVGGARAAELQIEPEPGLVMPASLRFRAAGPGRQAACVLLHLNGKDAALKHPLAAALVNKGWVVVAPDLRGTGAAAPADGIAGAPDHTTAEHAVWVGRPLLGQWAYDVLALLHWMGQQPGQDARRFAVVGIGQAGLVALVAAGLFDDRVAAAAAVEAPATLVTELAYGEGTRMGLLAPGLFRAGDVPQLAALCAPRRVVLAGGTSPQGRRLTGEQLKRAYAFTAGVYALTRAGGRLTVAEELTPADLAVRLAVPGA
jgi:pimeloyl-ACP methyl ester carboxylesterase